MKEFSNGNYNLIENHIVPKKEKRSFLLKLNGYTILFLVVSMILAGIHIGFTMQHEESAEITLLGVFLFMISFALYIVVHELLHGLAFKLFNGNKWSELKFGVVLKSGVAYCISTVPVKVNAARLSLMMPVYVVCIPLYIIGIILKMPGLVILSVFFVTGSTGDFYYMWKLRKTSKKYYMVEEMPTPTGYEIGYKLYEKVD